MNGNNLIIEIQDSVKIYKKEVVGMTREKGGTNTYVIYALLRGGLKVELGESGQSREKSADHYFSKSPFPAEELE